MPKERIMFGKVLKVLGLLLGALIVLLVVGAVIVYALANAKINQVYQVEVKPISIPTDAASIERGRHMASSMMHLKARMARS
jgi:hypothetical protein